MWLLTGWCPTKSKWLKPSTSPLGAGPAVHTLSDFCCGGSEITAAHQIGKPKSDGWARLWRMALFAPTIAGLLPRTLRALAPHNPAWWPIIFFTRLRYEHNLLALESPFSTIHHLPAAEVSEQSPPSLFPVMSKRAEPDSRVKDWTLKPGSFSPSPRYTPCSSSCWCLLLMPENLQIQSWSCQIRIILSRKSLAFKWNLEIVYCQTCTDSLIRLDAARRLCRFYVLTLMAN